MANTASTTMDQNTLALAKTAMVEEALPGGDPGERNGGRADLVE
ncbi:hypothetical protein [Rhizobium leguminosarum]